jgi:hypothetical protein
MQENNFGIYKCALYDVLGPNDDRLRVRILPYMMDIDETELDDLPAYPPFFRGQVVTGITEIEYGKEKCDVLWCIATPDFQTGFILGKANAFGANTKQKYPYSYNFGEIKKYLDNRHATPDDFDYEHIVIRLKTGSEDYLSDKEAEAYKDPKNKGKSQGSLPAGGVIELYNYLTGDYVLLNTSGSVLCVMQHQIYIRVGTPSASGGGGSTFSAIKLTADEINLKAPRIFLDGKKVMLGSAGLNVLGTISSSPVHAEGVPLVPSPMGHVTM